MTDPGMRRTGWTDLVLPFVVAGALVYLLLRWRYSALPPLQLLTPLPLAALGVAELVAACRVRAAVSHDPHAKPMAALVIARCVALAKASALVGALVAGAAVALLVQTLPDAADAPKIGHDALVGVLLLAASLLLVGAALLLERAGIDPNRDRRDRGN